MIIIHGAGIGKCNACKERKKPTRNKRVLSIEVRFPRDRIRDSICLRHFHYLLRNLHDHPVGRMLMEHKENREQR